MRPASAVMRVAAALVVSVALASCETSGHEPADAAGSATVAKGSAFGRPPAVPDGALEPEVEAALDRLASHPDTALWTPPR